MLFLVLFSLLYTSAVSEPFGLDGALATFTSSSIKAQNFEKPDPEVTNPSLEKLVKQNILFDKTMKSSVRSKHVMDVTKIGFFGLPGSGVEEIFEVMNQLAVEMHFLETGKVIMLLELRVPPYGYGKNHGFTSIVRVTRPVLSHAQLLLPSTDKDNTSMLDAQVRQFIRWHCRLSHVAAHTAVHTVFADRMTTNPVNELLHIAHFLKMDVGGVDGAAFSQFHLTKIVQKFNENIQPGNKIGSTRKSFGDSDVYIFNVSFNPFVEESSISLSPECALAAASAIETELHSSNNLAKWPCATFQSIKGHEQLPISWSSLIPNCTKHKCMVPQDSNMKG